MKETRLPLRAILSGLLLIVVIGLATKSSAQWVTDPVAGTQSLRSLQMIDPTTGWVAGSGSTLFSTVDGKTWTTSPTGFSGNYTSITFSDNAGISGYIVGDMPLILRTTDAGLDWASASSATTNPLNSVSFAANTDSGWAVGNNGTIVASKDAGVSWHTQVSGTTSSLFGVQSLNSFAVWAVGDKGTILNSTDGGGTWLKAVMPVTNTLYAIDMADYRNGWIVGDQVILHTKDGGVTWVKQTFTAPTTLRSVVAIDTAYAYAGGANGRILYTTDGGATWTDEVTGFLKNIYALQFTSDAAGWAACDNGTLLTHAAKQSVAAPSATEPQPGESLAELEQNYPNPFAQSTSIKYRLKERGMVTVSVFDQLGRLVKNLSDGEESAGTHSVVWDSRSAGSSILPAGVYFCKLSVIGSTVVRKMVVAR